MRCVSNETLEWFSVFCFSFEQPLFGAPTPEQTPRGSRPKPRLGGGFVAALGLHAGHGGAGHGLPHVAGAREDAGGAPGSSAAPRRHGASVRVAPGGGGGEGEGGALKRRSRSSGEGRVRSEAMGRAERQGVLVWKGPNSSRLPVGSRASWEGFVLGVLKARNWGTSL